VNYYERHIGDYLKDTAHLSLLEHGVYTRLLDVYYTREGGIPAADAARLIGARTREEKQALAAVLGEFFRLDGGHHLQDRCDREIERYRESQEEAGGRRENDKERQRRARERRKQLFEQLRRHDIVPAWDCKTSDLEAMLSRVTGAQPSQHKSEPVTQPVTRDNTATQTPDPDTRPNPKEKERAAEPPPPPARTREEEPPPEANGAQPTQAGLVCRAMRQAGLADTNPGDPRFLALLAQGATQAEFAGLAAEAVAKRRGWAWVLSVLQSRRQEAAQIALAPPAPPPQQTVPSGEADSTAAYLRERAKPLTPEEQAKADEARRAAMSRLGRPAARTRSPA